LEGEAVAVAERVVAPDAVDSNKKPPML
jgi:hypothetical protein